jgi:hypothetical protein
MALVFADRVKVRARTSGTGTFTLENTVAGFQSFSVIGDGNQTYYGIVDSIGNWEIGLGTYTASGTTLSRDQVISSSNSNQLVNFSVGSKNVYTTIPSSLIPPILGAGTGDITFNGNAISSGDSSEITFLPQTEFNSNIIVDGDLILDGDNRIQASTGINLIPNQSAESFGSTLNIQGVPGGEGFPGVVISTQSSYIQVGSWIMFTDGGLYSTPLSDAPDFPLSGTIYTADGVNWDPANYQSGTPYPVFYDGNDFLPMTASPPLP